MKRLFIIVAAILSAGLIGQAADQPSTQPAAIDLSTPAAAVITYFNAVDRGDVPTAKLASTHNVTIEKFIDEVIAENSAEQRFRDAATKRWGPDDRLSILGSSSDLIDAVKSGVVHEHGDTAEIGDHGNFPCRRVDGKWRFDLVCQNSDPKTLQETLQYLPKSADNYNQFASRVASGDWHTLDEAEKALDAAAPQPPAPPESK